MVASDYYWQCVWKQCCLFFLSFEYPIFFGARFLIFHILRTTLLRARNKVLLAGALTAIIVVLEATPSPRSVAFAPL